MLLAGSLPHAAQCTLQSRGRRRALSFTSSLSFQQHTVSQSAVPPSPPNCISLFLSSTLLQLSAIADHSSFSLVSPGERRDWPADCFVISRCPGESCCVMHCLLPSVCFSELKEEEEAAKVCVTCGSFFPLFSIFLRGFVHRGGQHENESLRGIQFPGLINSQISACITLSCWHFL